MIRRAASGFPFLPMLIAASVGAAAAWWFTRPAQEAGPPRLEMPDVSETVASALREDRYATLRTIDDVRSLPGEFAENEALHAVAARADAAAVQDLLYQALRVPEALRRDAMVDILLLRLVDLDPRSALAFAEGPLRRTGRRYAPTVYGLWARKDFDTALTTAALASGPKGRVAAAFYRNLPFLDDPRAAEIEAALGVRPSSEVVAEAIERAYGESPERALAVLASLPNVSSVSVHRLAALLYADLGVEAFALVESSDITLGREMLEGALMMEYGAYAPAAAIERILADDADTNAFALATAFKSLARENVGEAVRQFARLPDSRGRELEEIILGQLANDDVATAVVFVDAVRHLERDEALSRIIRRAGPSQLTAALDAVSLIEDDERAAYALVDLSRRMPAGDMPVMAARIAGIDIGNRRMARDMLSNFAANWVRKDADAAMAWAQALPDDQRDSVMAGVVRQLARSDPGQAARLAADVAGVAGSRTREMLVSQLVRNDEIGTALALARGVDSPGERRRLESAALTRLAASDPERAMMLARERGDQDLQDLVLAATVENGVANPQRALERARGIVDPLVRNQAIMALVSRRALQDLPAARGFVESLATTEERDAGLAGLARAPGLEVDEALALAERISDESVRQQAQLQLLFPLAMRDPDRARSLIDGMDLPPMMRDQIELLLRQRGLQPSP